MSGIDLRNSVGIEIGALDKPIVRRADGEIIYVDFSTTEDLIKKYHSDPSVNIENIVDVNAIWGKNTLLQAIGGKKLTTLSLPTSSNMCLTLLHGSRN